MLSELVGLFFGNPSSASAFQGDPPASIVIFAGTGDSRYRSTDAQAVRKAQKLSVFETMPDGTLCAKLNEISFVIVRPSEPVYKNLRYKKYLTALFEKYGTQTPFPFGKLEEGEFKGILDAQLQTAASLVPTAQTQVCFSVGLRCTLDASGFPVESTFGPDPKPDANAIDLMKRYPAGRLENRELILKRMQSLTPTPEAVEFSKFPYSSRGLDDDSETGSYRAVRSYLRDQSIKADQLLDPKLAGPIYDQCREMRKLKTVSDVQSKDPRFYRMLRSFFDSDIELVQPADRPNIEDRFARANIFYSYTFSVTGWDGKKQFTFQLR